MPTITVSRELKEAAWDFEHVYLMGYHPTDTEFRRVSEHFEILTGMGRLDVQQKLDVARELLAMPTDENE